VRWGVELGFRGTEGVMKHSSRKNANAAFYVDYRIGGLQIKNKVTYTYNKSTDVPFNSFSDYSHLLPYMRLYDENGDYVGIDVELAEEAFKRLGHNSNEDKTVIQSGRS
jgi:hypothetical protein